MKYSHNKQCTNPDSETDDDSKIQDDCNQVNHCDVEERVCYLHVLLSFPCNNVLTKDSLYKLSVKSLPKTQRNLSRQVENSQEHSKCFSTMFNSSGSTSGQVLCQFNNHNFIYFKALITQKISFLFQLGVLGILLTKCR